MICDECGHGHDGERECLEDCVTCQIRAEEAQRFIDPEDPVGGLAE